MWHKYVIYFVCNGLCSNKVVLKELDRRRSATTCLKYINCWLKRHTQNSFTALHTCTWARVSYFVVTARQRVVVGVQTFKTIVHRTRNNFTRAVWMNSVRCHALYSWDSTPGAEDLQLLLSHLLYIAQSSVGAVSVDPLRQVGNAGYGCSDVSVRMRRVDVVRSRFLNTDRKILISLRKYIFKCTNCIKNTTYWIVYFI